MPASVLVAGGNVIAFEIYQRSPQSSDISFDLSLEGIRRHPDRSHSGAVVGGGGLNQVMSQPQRARMFPLSSVLFPRGVLPLHIFEPRYLAMIREAIDDDASFGVVLIERGSEVGGGDTRFGVGTMASIIRAGVVDDDRMAILTMGTDRFDVAEWIEEEPYPAAMVTKREETAAREDLTLPIAAALRSWQRVVALASEIGADVGSGELELPPSPEDAIWTLCAVSPLEQMDRQRLLEIDAPEERAEYLRVLLDEQATVLEARLAGRMD